MTFGTFISTRRKEAKLNLRDTAKHLGISNGYLCDIEQGRRPAPEGAFVERISSFLELDKQEHEKYWLLRRMRGMFRVKGRSWWGEEMPNAREYVEALKNLEQVNWKVDCILSHCGPSSVVRKIDPSYGSDQLTDFLETVNQRCQFTYWFFGHYHDNRIINDRYILQWEQISGLEI